MDIPESVTTTTNVAYIELFVEVIRTGSWFDLTWLQVPRSEASEDVTSKLRDKHSNRESLLFTERLEKPIYVYTILL